MSASMSDESYHARRRGRQNLVSWSWAVPIASQGDVRSGSIATRPSQQQVWPCPLSPESGSKFQALAFAAIDLCRFDVAPGRYDKLAANYLAFVKAGSYPHLATRS